MYQLSNLNEYETGSTFIIMLTPSALLRMQFEVFVISFHAFPFPGVLQIPMCIANCNLFSPTQAASSSAEGIKWTEHKD